MFLFVLIFFLSLVVESPSIEAAFHPERSTPRSLGISDASVSSADDSSAFVFNPAGLSRQASMRKISGNGHFQRRVKDYNVSGAFVDGVTEDPLHWGFRFQHHHASLSKFQDYALALGSLWSDYLLFGTSQHLQHFGRTAAARPTWVYNLHLGLLLLLNDHWALGLSLENPYRFSKKRAVDPTIVRSGLSLNLEKWRFLVQHDLDTSHETHGLKAGLEWKMLVSFTLRAGAFHELNRSFRRQDDLPRGYSVGASLEPDPHFSLDLAFLDQLRSSERYLSFGLAVKI